MKSILSNSPLKAAVKMSVFPAFFLCISTFLHAQAPLDLGSASLSQNWGSSSSKQNEPQQVVMLQKPSSNKHSASHTAATAPVSTASSAKTSLASLTSLAQPTVPGRRAVVKRGIAYAPEEAPLCVKQAIWATNTILRKPYVWGGGHDSFSDRGYDCSGSVSFVLHYAGQLSSPTDSRSLMSFGQAGPGRWITIYARNGHTFMVVAGLRMDTTGNFGDEGPRWRTTGRSPWGFTARHPVGL